MNSGYLIFDNELRELVNQFGIDIKHTAAYNPCSNSLNERSHSTIDWMVVKMLEDSRNLNKAVAFNYAVLVCNCRLYLNHFTPA